MSAILLRNLRSYAVTMTGWVFVAFILVFMGIFTMTYNLTGGYSNFEYVLSELKIVYLVGVPVHHAQLCRRAPQPHRPAPLRAPLELGQHRRGQVPRHARGSQRPACRRLPRAARPRDVWRRLLPTAYLTIGAFFLMGAACAAIGMLVSSLCESQVTAAVGCFVILLVDYFLTSLVDYIPADAATAVVVLTIAILLAGAGLTALTRNGIFAFGLAVLAEVVLVAVFLINGSALEGLIGDMLSGLSLFDRFSPFVNGIVDLASVTFYLAVSAVFAS